MTTVSNIVEALNAHSRALESHARALMLSSAQDPDAGASVAQASGAPGRFTARGEIVEDSLTGLTWTRRNVGGKRMTWSDAKAACTAAREGGFDDWRLPTIQELLTLVDYSRTQPAIDPAFECESNWYWSATPYSASPAGCAWSVGFGYGDSFCNDQDGESCVRAVRSGQLIGSLV